MSRRDGEELDNSASIDAVLFPERPGRRPRRRLTNRVMRAIKWFDRLPLTLTVGTLFLIGMALTLATLYVCYY